MPQNSPTIIETLAGQFFRVTDYATAELAHVWEGVEVKRTKAGFVDKKHARKFPVRKIGTRLVETAQMVPQPVQQQQAKSRETTEEWKARILAKRAASARPAVPAGYVASPAINAGIALAQEIGVRRAEKQIAAAAEHGIDAPLARAGRYGKAA